MKKIVLFIVLLLIPIIVNADTEVFKEVKETKQNQIIFAIKEYKDGYLALVQEYEEQQASYYLKYVDKNGETIKKTPFESTYISAQILYDDEYIYTFKESYHTSIITRYNQDLEKQNELIIEDHSPAVVEIDILYRFLPVKEKDNYFYFVGEEGEFVRIKKDLSSYEVVNITDEEFKTILPEEYYKKKIKETLPSSYEVFGVDIKNNYIVTNIMDVNSNCPANTEEFCGGQLVRIYDKELNIIKEFVITQNIDAPKRNIVLYVGFIKDYLVMYGAEVEKVIDILNDEPHINSFINIYNLDWELIQTIDKPSSLTYLMDETDNGFIMDFFVISGNIFVDRSDDMFLTFFSIVSPIDVPTIDHGRVIVPSTGAAGETVTVEVKPEKGYTLGELIVMDAEGNKLPITNNSFVMGTSKVTVTALFVPENPNTGNFYVILICLIAAISGIVLVFQKRKLDFLK